MPVNLKIEVDGLKELKKAFDKAPRIVLSAMNNAIKEAIMITLASARPMTPIDTGFLRGPGMQVTFGQLTGVLENVAPYAIYVHEGTRFMKGRPFFAHAIRFTKDRVDQVFRTALSQITRNLTR